jgi:hypothetical protein
VADTLKTQILDNLVTVIDAIVANGTYNRTVRAASRAAKTLTEAQRDVVFITNSPVTKIQLVNSVTQCTLTAFVACVVEDATDLDKAVDDMAADVEKAICTDITRSGSAIDTNVVSVENQVIEEMSPMGTCVLEVSILYRHQFGDPYTAIGG